MKCLLIEDDAETAASIRGGLERQGHVVAHAGDGTEGLQLAADSSFAVVIVDRMLPGADGLSIVRTMRRASVNTPVLFLTTLGGIDDRVRGFEAGGDDYLVKPFALPELVARLKALARRPPLTDGEVVLRVADLELDRLGRKAMRAGRRLDLQPREFALLEYLVKNAGDVVTKTMLLENVWGFHFDPHTNVVETHVSRLRAKVDRGHARALIETVRGSGYKIRHGD